MCMLMWGRVFGAKMLKMGKKNGCISSKSANSLPCEVAPQNKQGMEQAEGAGRRGIACLQAPSGATLQGLETTCNSSAGDSRRKVLPQAGAAPMWHSDEFCLLLASCKEGKGAERSWDPEDQIKAMTDELWQEQLWQAPFLFLAEKQFPLQLSCLGLNPTHHQFGHQRHDGRNTLSNRPWGRWGRGAMQNICRQILVCLSVAAAITSPWSP